MVHSVVLDFKTIFMLKNGTLYCQFAENIWIIKENKYHLQLRKTNSDSRRQPCLEQTGISDRGRLAACISLSKLLHRRKFCEPTSS